MKTTFSMSARALQRMVAVLLVLVFLGVLAAPVWAEDPPSSAPTGESRSGSIYISAYNVVDSNGAAILTLTPGTKSTVVFVVVDERFKQSDIALEANLKDHVHVTLTPGTFSSVSDGDIKIDRRAPVNEKLSYSVTFNDTVYVGPEKSFSFDVSMTEKDDEGRDKSFGVPITTLSQSIAQCAASKDTTITTAKPNVMVKDSSYGATTVDAGAVFTLVLTSYNTSKSVALTDVVTTLSLPAGLTLAGGSNTVLTTNVPGGGTFANSFVLQAQNSVETSVLNITVNYSFYAVGVTEPLTTSQLITVAVVQPDRFAFTETQLPIDAFAGQENILTMGFVNKGKGILYNLSAEVTGNMKTPGQVQYIGNLASGTQNSIDFTIASDTAQAVNGVVVVTYENANGVETKQTKEFTVEIGEAPEQNLPMPDISIGGEDIPQQAGMPWWAWVIIGVAVLVVIIVIIKVRKSIVHKKKMAALEEDDDEDF